MFALVCACECAVAVCVKQMDRNNELYEKGFWWCAKESNRRNALLSCLCVLYCAGWQARIVHKCICLHAFCFALLSPFLFQCSSNVFESVYENMLLSSVLRFSH